MIKPLKIQIRFSDIDLMGHVNNAVYLNYFESARMDCLVQLLGKDWDWRKYGMILKVNEIEYHSPVHLDDEISIVVKLQDIGTKSFTLAYELLADKEIKTTGKSVLVSYDFTQKKSTELSDSFKNALKKLQA
jgi:acyl-CoA thioester hydrolase